MRRTRVNEVCGMKSARERRRLRNSFPDDKEEESRKETTPSRVGSTARARRRAKLLNSEILAKLSSREWGSDDVHFDVLRQIAQTGNAWNIYRRRNGAAATSRRKSEGIRFSLGIDSKADLITSSVQLDKAKENLLPSGAKLRNGHEYKALDRSSADRTLLDSNDDVRKYESSAVFGGKENYSFVKVLSTLLPDEILRDINAVDPKEFFAAVLLLDVTGFTELSEKFDKTGKGGPSRLSEVLNNNIGAKIQVILSRSGDVCKFGGDAILCFWKASSEGDLSRVVPLAVDSALDMQRRSRREDDVGVEIRVKITVAAGQVMFATIGELDRKYHVLLGKPVMETNQAEKLCLPGEVIVAPSAWRYVSNYLTYSYSKHPTRGHILVQDFGPLWTQSKPIPEQMSKRSTLKLAGILSLEDLRPFILPFVMKCIDNNEPLDYLTEMRQVAIVFLKLEINEVGMSSRELYQISDKAYQEVWRIVERVEGVVNKLTCFDKDVSILIVFGLRGFKTDSASKAALKCAYTCVDSLKKLTKVGVSAGVTTGMVYCGVIGHPLRREFTVMGLPVNKAARLMCAYTDIVSCDRETYLQSKLRSAHFKVLERKPIKGIQHVGPIYEFSLSVKRCNIELDSVRQPLLGRLKEIDEFLVFLRQYKTHNGGVNFFVVYGGARIGKTRLISTLISIAEEDLSGGEEQRTTAYQELQGLRRTSSNVDICVVQLTEEDYKTSYSTVRRIFQPALGLSDSSTVKEREEKIELKLADVKDTCHLAALNQIFNVNFHYSANYLRMNQEEQLSARRVVKKKLYKVCFPKDSKWLVVIDDAEFIDEASWLFLKWSSTISNDPIFLVTIGEQKALSTSASECLFSIPQHKIVLGEIDKWYYTALACQILEVKAIPVELENLLQGFKNSGNPGWLESYLLSLLQTDCLQVSYMMRQEMNNLKLVSAALGKLSEESSVSARRSESPFWMDWIGSFKQNYSTSSEIVPICILGPNFVNTTNEDELTMDLMHVKAIDKLNPLEQLILKSGSVLGYNFRRDAVYQLITKELNVEERPFAKAIKYLFEIRILCCDNGDFTCPSSLIMSRRVVPKDNFQKAITCDCIGLVKSGAVQNLPDYASCGFMRFRSPVFKDTAYKMLLDEQKKKFHQISIDYLRKNTYRCIACRNVLFDCIFGREVNDELRLVCTSTPTHGAKLSAVTCPRKYREKTTQVFDIGRRDESSETSDESFALRKDISDCQCSHILSSVYSALLEHAEACGRRDIMLEVSFEYALVNLTSHNIPLTMQILEDTLKLVKTMHEENDYPEMCTPFIYGKIYTLMGATNISMGRFDIALNVLGTALKYLGKRMPKKEFDVNVRLKCINLEKKMIMKFFPEKLIGTVSGKKAAHMDLLSECLSLMCKVHMRSKRWLLAKFTSTWALNKALRSYKNFYGLCTSCANVMDVAYHYNDGATSSKMEMLAIDVCENCSRQLLEVYDMEAIASLYKTIFKARHVRAEIEDAVYIGFKSIRIASIIRNSSMRQDLMPDLIFALIQVNRLSEAVSLLQELELVSIQYSNKASRTWYYAICLDFQLDTGYTVLTFKECEKFVNEEEENFHLIRSICAAERLCISMWLWCIRNGEWDASKRYASLMRNQEAKDRMKTPSSVYTKLKKLEGLLIILANKVGKHHVHARLPISMEITEMMRALRKETKVVPLLRPRYLLMKAYHEQIKKRGSNVLGLLKRAQSLAEKMGDRSTASWIIHNKMVWRNAIPSAQKTFWNDHCKYDDFVDWHEAGSVFGKEAFMFSLPLPENKALYISPNHSTANE